MPVKRSIKTGLLIVLFVLLLPVTLPIALVVISVAECHKRKQKCRCAEATACEKCGATLGRESLKLADKAWAEHFRKIMADAANRQVRLRIVRTLDAICPACGARYTYFEKRQKFEIESLVGQHPKTIAHAKAN